MIWLAISGRLGTAICLFLVAGPTPAAEGQAGGPLAGTPELTAHDVRNAADHSTGGVAPGEVVVLSPSNAGPPEMVPWGLEANLGVTDAIGETRVYFDNAAAPIIYTVRGRICTVVPIAVAGRKSTELVVEYQGKRSVPVTLIVVSSAPAIFTLDASGKGQAAMLNETGCCNSVRNPAVLGTVVSLYATGEGKLTPRRTAREVSVTVGGVPAPILFTQNEGSLQVDFRVPANAPAGDAVPLVLTVFGRRSSPEVTMALRSPRQRVLVVDGNAAIRASLARILGGAGYQVFTATEFEEAEGRISQRPDLLILDLEGHREKARDMIGKLRAARPEMRILALASDLNPQSLKEADLLGAQSVLTKPLNVSTVLSGVRTLLRKRPAVY